MDFLAKNVRVIKKSSDINSLLPQILMGAPNINPEQLLDIKSYDADDINKDALTLELESFIDCLKNNKKPVVDGEAGTRALEIATKIINQIQTHYTIFPLLGLCLLLLLLLFLLFPRYLCLPVYVLHFALLAYLLLL